MYYCYGVSDEDVIMETECTIPFVILSVSALKGIIGIGLVDVSVKHVENLLSF